MNAIVTKVLELAKKLGYLALQYFFVALAWVMKWAKVQLHKIKRGGEQKKVAKACSGLGAEIYALHKQADASDWKSADSVQQQLKWVEDAENAVFQVDAVIDELNRAFESRKQEIKDKYAAKRQESSSPGEPEQHPEG
jgi:hypothetical protein